MTPAIDLAKKLKLAFSVHEYVHDANNTNYGFEAVEKLQLNAEQVFKTLVIQLETGELVVAVVPVTHQLSLKKLAKHFKVKKATMATAGDVERSTGYVLGGVSPLGQKKRLKTVIDASAQPFDTVFVSAGRRGLEIELAPSALQQTLTASFADIQQH